MMFDFIRNLGRSEEQRQQEALSAFLDGELAPDEIARVEQDLASNSNLREELAEMQLWKSQMRDLPARRVPRNFTLDPGIYGRPQRRPFAGAYPVLRTATAVTAFLFVIALAINLYTGGLVENLAPQPEAAAVMSSPAEEDETAARAETVTEALIAPTSETFKLEESEGAQADELAIGLVEEPTVAAEAESAEEMPVEEAEVAEREELLSAKPQEAPALELEPVDDSILGSQASPESAAPPVEEMQDAEIAAAEEALKAQEAPRTEIPAAGEAFSQTAVPEQTAVQEAPLAEKQQFLQPPADEGPVQETAPSTFSSLSLLVIGLGLLFVLLVILTLLARGQR
ncbi:MAG: anti-sigma factor family protein [Candidatus Promineifilaceae bacterium]|jgi:anti-sigma factor RsiW